MAPWRLSCRWIDHHHTYTGPPTDSQNTTGLLPPPYDFQVITQAASQYQLPDIAAETHHFLDAINIAGTYHFLFDDRAGIQPIGVVMFDQA
jgi:hypothetical protein